MANETALRNRKTTGHSGATGEKGFVDKAWETQARVEKRFQKIGAGRYARVLKMARKPEPEEFTRTSLITGIGLLVIGLIGFIIFLLMDLINSSLGLR